MEDRNNDIINNEKEITLDKLSKTIDKQKAESSPGSDALPNIFKNNLQLDLCNKKVYNKSYRKEGSKSSNLTSRFFRKALARPL